MSIRLTRRRGLGLAMAIMAVLAALLGASSQTGTASAATKPSVRVGHVITPLPGCAVTFAPKVSNSKGHVCLKTLAQLEKTAGKAGTVKVQAVRPGMARPGTATPDTVYDGDGCFFDYYANGPYGSAAWASGWGVCVNAVADNGDYFVPPSLNDQASSWDSCTDGYFYANQPGTSPAAYFPAGSSGNFPWVSPPELPVPNDSLSSALVYYLDLVC